MITIFQHGKDESPGEIGSGLSDLGYSFTVVRLYETNEVPADLPTSLIVLGGQMSVNNTREYPYFLQEMELIRKMVARRRPVMGICLGAQMIASAFGEQVFPSTPEHGWHPVRSRHPNSFPFPKEPFRVFHWHNETFNLPTGATLLLQGEHVKNQAYRMGSAVGVQFHPEVTTDIISRWAEELSPNERIPLLEYSAQEITANRERCRDLTEKFLNHWRT